MLGFAKSDEEVLEMLSEVDAPAALHKVGFEQDSMRYATIGDDPDRPLLLLIHGVPGSLTELEAYWTADILERFDILTIDRPEYSPSHKVVEYTIEEQVEIIYDLIQSLGWRLRPITLLTYSYGGP